MEQREPQFDYLKQKRDAGVPAALLLSAALHILAMATIYVGYKNIVPPPPAPPVRYVELAAAPPQPAPAESLLGQFTEAPGRPLAEAPARPAPLSDANRRAAMPKPTGDQPTTRPGQGGIYVPGSAPAGTAGSRGAPATEEQPQSPDNPTTRQPDNPSERKSSINWNAAIRQLGGRPYGEGLGGNGSGAPGSGGERGYAETGALSFETQWFEWGDYGARMVAKIRKHWNDNMPQLLRMGVKGVVTVRFTIHRDGRVSDITMLDSTGQPPYEFAAKKAIELASALPPLPDNFPKDSERVTARFFYNRNVN